MLMVLFGMAAFCFLIQTPNHPWLYRDVGVDTWVFQTVAMMMQDGFMPYKDSFDHKGPLLYIIDFIGRAINDRWGVCLMQWCSLTYSLVFFFKIAKLVTRSWTICLFSIFVAGLFLLNLFYWDYGNLAEEYAMPLIATGTFFFLRYYLTGSRENWSMIVCGCCFAGVLMLRPNMIALWLVFCPAILISDVRQQRLNEGIRSVIYFCVGVVLVLLPILGWITWNGAWDDFWRAYVVFNVDYANSLPSLWLSRLYAFWHFGTMPIVMLTLGSVFYFLTDSWFKNQLMNVYAFYLLVALGLVALSGRLYGHYAMVLVPAVVYPIAIATKHLVISNQGLMTIERYFERNLKAFMGLLCIVFLGVTLAVSSVVGKRTKGNNKDDTTEVCQLIERHTDSKDEISVYGNFDKIYVFTHRQHATRFSYQFPIFSVNSRIEEEYWRDMRKELPKIVVIQDYMDERMRNFLEEFGYRLISSSRNKHRVFLREK